MKLNIYDKKKIVKTYEVENYDILFGTLEDFADAIDLDGLKTGSDIEIIKLAGKLFVKSKETIKNLFKDVFDGLTDDELKHVSVKEMKDVIIELVHYMIGELNFGNIGNNRKN